MAKEGNGKTPRSVKAEFVENEFATPLGGAVLFEQAFRALGIRKMLGETLPERGGVYTSQEISLQVLAGLLLEGKGFQATEPFHQDSELARIFGFANVASAPTVYRAMCDLSGLEQRTFEKVYTPAGPRPSTMDVFGEEAPGKKHRRTVPDEPEEMGEGEEKKWDTLLQRTAKCVGKSLDKAHLDLHGFVPVFGDGTDLEVRGSCFDAAEKNRHGDQCLRAMVLMTGPLIAALSILPGNADEGLSLPALLERSKETVKSLAGRKSVLALLDAAFAEKQVIDALGLLAWNFIVCANQYSSTLERLAEEQPEGQWLETGADESRGWSESAVLTMNHHPEGWPERVRVVVRRWKNNGEHVHRYSFLYTNLAAGDLPAKLVAKHGFASAIWQLYGTKQGRENNFKRLLTDMGLHHPVSGRLGPTQAMGYLAAVATNVQAFISYKVVPKEDRGIRHWRFVRDYVLLVGRIVIQSGRRLLVRIAGGGLPEERIRRFLAAQAKLAGT